jgi:hypothetical protein
MRVQVAAQRAQFGVEFGDPFDDLHRMTSGKRRAGALR